jgi:hypothetical protein
LGYDIDGRGSIPGNNKKKFLFHGVQTGSGVRPASYPLGTKGFLPRGKAAGA